MRAYVGRIAPRAAVAVLVFALILGGCARGKDLNVLFITLDTTRADHLHCYGHRFVDTPHLDRLAQEGILFENAFSEVPVTLPSHSSIFTGLTPVAHGVRDNGTYRLSDDAVTMAEVLHDRGYETAAVVGAFVLHSSFGLAQGFDHYDEDFSQGRSQSEFHFVERTADQVTDAAIDWLSERGGARPFFLWVHYFDPHLNYAPPSPFKERYPYTLYDGEISFTDWQLGRLREYLEENGLWDRTLVVVVGDHGEGLMEHGERSHSFTVYDALIHVPLIISHPGSRAQDPPGRWRPRRLAEQVQTIDILPTVAALTGGPLAREVEGRSLLPLLDGASWSERAAYAETLIPFLSHRWAPLRAVRYQNLKYIRAPEPELYDLTADPHELTNLAAQRPGDVARMDQELRLLVERSERFSLVVQEAALGSADRDKLASLGYLQAGNAAHPIEELDPSELELPNPDELVSAVSNCLSMGMDPIAHDKPEDAERLFRLFLEADPHPAEGHFQLGIALRMQGRVEEALEEFTEAARLNPGSFKPALHLGITNLWMQRTEEARLWAEKARELNPYSGEPLVVLGNLAEGENKFEEALAYFDQALAIDSGNSTFHLARGTVLGKMGREEESRREIELAVELVPHAEYALKGLAKHLGKSGRPELALPLFLELVEIDPLNPLYQGNAGNCYLLGGDYPQAAEQFRKAVELAPGEAQYHYMLGCAYAGMHNYAQAQACWERTLELAPEHAEARENLELLRRGELR